MPPDRAWFANALAARSPSQSPDDSPHPRHQQWPDRRGPCPPRRASSASTFPSLRLLYFREACRSLVEVPFRADSTVTADGKSAAPLRRQGGQGIMTDHTTAARAPVRADLEASE